MASKFQTVNPASGEVLHSYQHLEEVEVLSAIESAYDDFQKWKRASLAQRSKVLHQLADSFRERKTELAQLMNHEMGKLMDEGRAEIEKCAITCEYYAQEAEHMLAPQEADSPYKEARVVFEPLGVIFSVMPWNFPLWQVVRFAAPGLMAGNVILLKHADLTAGVGAMLEQIFRDLHPDLLLLRNIHVDHEMAAKVIADHRVRGVTFTGSTVGGRAVAQEAAKNLKKVVLELGGSDAYIILADADLDLAAKSCARSRLLNCGQSCIAGKRFIVDEKVAADFVTRFSDELKKIELGPLASKRFQGQVAQQVERLKSWGGRVVIGGTLPQGPGAFYPATLVVFEKNHPEIHRIEVFGPVAIVIVAKDQMEAVDLANSSPYGLGGGVFTRDVKEGRRLIEKELEAGFVVLNDFVRSDPRIPFGGVKESGYGRELGHFGILEFVNIKTVAIGEAK